MVAIIDSGFWFAFFDKNDPYHKYTDSIIKKLDECADKIVIQGFSCFVFFKKRGMEVFFLI